MNDSIIQTTDPVTMSDSEILEEYDGYPTSFPDTESYRLVLMRKLKLAEEHNSRGQKEMSGPGIATRRYLNE